MSAIDTIQSVKDATACPVEARKNTRARKFPGMLLALFGGLERQFERRRSRRMLLELSDSQLKDIGVSRADAYREGIRSLFD